MATSPLQQVGPIRVFARYPGCEEVTTDLVIPSMSEGLELVTISMEPSGLATGSLRIDVVGLSEAVRGIDLAALVMTLRLNPMDDDPGHVEKAVLDGTWFEGDTLVVDGIPHGSYGVDLDFGALDVKLSEPATISDEPTGLAFTLEALDAGSILVEVRDRHGVPFRGRAEFELRRPDESYILVGHVFSSAPYRIPVVGPGRYRIEMIAAWAGEGDYPTARSPTFDVVRGQQSTVMLAFDRME